jgi:hypothetical protein
MGMVDGREPEESDADRYRDLPARVAVKFAPGTGMVSWIQETRRR